MAQNLMASDDLEGIGNRLTVHAPQGRNEVDSRLVSIQIHGYIPPRSLHPDFMETLTE